MADNVDIKTRSRIMSEVRSTGNKSTEWRLRAHFMREGIKGWRVNATDLPGKPDFVFDDEKVAVFVDGCFWHFCPLHCRLPKSRTEYWHKKIKANRHRDKQNSAKLRANGWRVVRLWEHTIKDNPGKAVQRIQFLLGET